MAVAQHTYSSFVPNHKEVSLFCFYQRCSVKYETLLNTGYEGAKRLLENETKRSTAWLKINQVIYLYREEESR